MWKSITGFARRHRRKFFVLGGFVGGIYIFRRILVSKLSEWENRQTQDFLEQMKRYHHFEGTIQTCDSTILSLVPKVRETVQSILKVDDLIEQLKTNPQKKLQIWEELKILVFSEAISEICGEILLVTFLRVQLSVIGGYMYIDTQKQGTPSNGLVISCSQDVQQKYLGCIHHFFNMGMQELITLIRDAVHQSFIGINLKHRVSFPDIQNVLENIKNIVLNGEKGILDNIPIFLLPDIDGSLMSGSSVENPATVLNKMILETRDVIETKDFLAILRDGIEFGFEAVQNRVAESMMHANQGDVVNKNEVSVPVAKIIPALHSHFKMYNDCSVNGTKGPFLQQLLQAEKSKTFAANIYEAFSQPLDLDQNIRPSIGNNFS